MGEHRRKADGRRVFSTEFRARVELHVARIARHREQRAQARHPVPAESVNLCELNGAARATSTRPQ